MLQPWGTKCKLGSNILRSVRKPPISPIPLTEPIPSTQQINSIKVGSVGSVDLSNIYSNQGRIAAQRKTGTSMLLSEEEKKNAMKTMPDVQRLAVPFSQEQIGEGLQALSGSLSPEQMSNLKQALLVEPGVSVGQRVPDTLAGGKWKSTSRRQGKISLPTDDGSEEELMLQELHPEFNRWM